MMNFKAFLEWARQHAPEQRTKGKWFEQAVKTWMRSDARFYTRMRDIWLWNEFPVRDSMGGGDLGIDLVAEKVTLDTEQNSEFCANQCKFYDKTTITKEHVDSFIAHSAGLLCTTYAKKCRYLAQAISSKK